MGGAFDVFRVFLKLGVTSFGGPVAHLGYFRDEIVLRRRWLSDGAYAEIVALCQFLPGPASSQVGFTLGWLRAGPLGACFAFLAFTTPSALIMIAFALGATALDNPLGQSLLHGLKLVAVAVVAHAVLGMARKLCFDVPRAVITVAILIMMIADDNPVTQVLAIAFGAIFGLVLCSAQTPEEKEGLRDLALSKSVAIAALVVFFLLLFGLPLMASGAGFAGLFDAFYRSGSLVFGGGHVVLPLLEAQTVGAGRLSDSAFLAGYGAAQAIPGPLFTFAGYLGAQIAPNGAVWLGALVAMAGIFLPGFLLVVGVLPFWSSLRQYPRAQSALAGVNAAVVGVLGAALYQPIWTSTVLSVQDFFVAALGFSALVSGRLAPWHVVVLVSGVTVILSLLS